jgi:hypothetical protein
MKGFLLGLVVAALGIGGYVYWKQHGGAAVRPPAVADAGAPGKQVREKKKRRHRGALRVARNDTFTGAASPEAASPRAGGPSPTEAEPADVFGGGPAASGGRPRPQAPAPPVYDEPEPEPIKLSAADLKMVGRGDDLSRPDVVHLDMSDDSGSHELTQDDIDARFRAKEDAILGCIAHARPDEETWVPGSVTVKFRIQRTGLVRGVRVEAPAILQKGGLYGCIKGVVGGIRFPPSGGSQVITYPFSLT